MVGGRTKGLALGVTLAVAISFIVGGIVGSRWIKSPQEAAADRRPPDASVLNSRVQYRVLTENLVTRGDVVAGKRVAILMTGSGDSRPIVTGVRVRKGQVVKPGQAVVEVSGRPILLLAGKTPMYRDLRPGADGKDVEQLQKALVQTGYGIGVDKAGHLGSGTEEAIRRVYSASGYDVPTTGDEGDVDAARDSVTQSERSRTAALLALERLERAKKPDDADATGTTQNELDDAKLALKYSQEDLAAAKGILAKALATSGPMLPISEVFFVPSFPATVSTVDVSLGSSADGTAITLDMGIPRITAAVDPQQRPLLRDGMKAKILVSSSDREIDATIRAIGPERESSQGGVVHAVTIVPDEELPRSAVGENVRITIRTVSTEQKVLVVPLSAITSSADRTTNVSVLDEMGEQHRIAVSPGVSAEGYVQVVPKDEGQLSEGDQVVIGS